MYDKLIVVAQRRDETLLKLEAQQFEGISYFSPIITQCDKLEFSNQLTIFGGYDAMSYQKVYNHRTAGGFEVSRKYLFQALISR